MSNSKNECWVSKDKYQNYNIDFSLVIERKEGLVLWAFSALHIISKQKRLVATIVKFWDLINLDKWCDIYVYLCMFEILYD